MSTPTRKAVPAVAPRPASTTLVLRDSAGGVEVLMVRRSLQASFMPGAYVFPGGAVDPADASADAQAVATESAAQLAQRIGHALQVGDAALAHAVGALRECFEECGLWLGADDADPALLERLRERLHGGEALAALAREAALPLHTAVLQPWSHWVTPVGVPRRFATLFFVVRAPRGQQPSVDAGETTTLEWVQPEAALQAHARGAFPMEFATVATVRALQPWAGGSVDALLQHAAAQPARAPVHPRLKLDADGGIVGALMPGEPGYAEAAGDGPG
jgi:8-oxo-dGTP pyrophosphatase MutT (NUDIX family)